LFIRVVLLEIRIQDFQGEYLPMEFADSRCFASLNMTNS